MAAWFRGFLGRNGKTLCLALALVIALGVGSGVLAYSAGTEGDQDPALVAGDDSSAPDTESGTPDPGTQCPGRPGRPGARVAVGLAKYLDMKPADLVQVVKDSEAKPVEVLMAAPIAKLGEKPLADVLALRKGGDAWLEVADACGVKGDAYLDELERVIGAFGRAGRHRGWGGGRGEGAQPGAGSGAAGVFWPGGAVPDLSGLAVDN
jgi:hypothetical protein